MQSKIMAWIYETKPLSTIYQLLRRHQTHPDYNILKEIARKAYHVALFFENEGFNDEFVRKYLNDELPCDAMAKFHLKSSVLGSSTDVVLDNVYSISHTHWLYDLAEVKLRWSWKQPDADLAVTQDKKFTQLMNKYHDIQCLALSYTSVFPNDD